MSAGDLADRESVREHYGTPHEMALAKELTYLDKHCRAFIALSPFIVLASSDAQGRCDATPRGDAPGFVTVINDLSFAIPDRTGNKRVDTMLNITDNPHIGVLFLVPGVNECLRVNGRVRVSLEPRLLAGMIVNGKTPNAATIVDVEEVYFQCGKAVLRSDLWNPEKRVPRGTFPSLGRVLADQIKGKESEGERYEKAIEERYRNALY
jgi:uncharacterized protein